MDDPIEWSIAYASPWNVLLDKMFTRRLSIHYVKFRIEIEYMLLCFNTWGDFLHASLSLYISLPRSPYPSPSLPTNNIWNILCIHMEFIWTYRRILCTHTIWMSASQTFHLMPCKFLSKMLYSNKKNFLLLMSYV